jgi:hypothetical protein
LSSGERWKCPGEEYNGHCLKRAEAVRVVSEAVLRIEMEMSR